MGTDLQTQLSEMRKGLALRPGEMNIHDLVPVLAPASFLTPRWPGPHIRLRTPDIGLTWGLVLPGNTMRYLNFSMQRHWEASGIDWRAAAMQNLRDRSQPQVATHTYQRSGGEVFSTAFMHRDGLGPARLLLREQLDLQFPRGYRVAIPERSCALAFLQDLKGDEFGMINGLIADCYKNGTRPFAPGIYDPDDLLPAR
jgi:hypothetical protein